MSCLNVYLDCGDSAQFLPVEVIDIKSRRRFTEALRNGTSTAVRVEPGQYLIQAVTPDGVLFSDQAEVADGAEANVLLRQQQLVEPTALPEWMEPAFSRWMIMRRVIEEYRRLTIRIRPQVSRRGRSRSQLWACVWSYDERWRLQPWPDTWIDWDGTSASFELNLPSRTLHALVVGGPAVASTVVVLPPTPKVIVSLRPDFSAGDVAITARTHNDGVESLLAYLTSGQLAAATALAGPVLEAKYLPYSESDPSGAVVGGLFLLRTRSLERLHYWFDHLRIGNAWLPDVSVVGAAQLLAFSEVPREKLRDRLLQAVDAGVPVYAQSLGWLYQGLQLLANESPKDEDVHVALEAVRPYADACDWSLALTTFGGISPAAPTFKRIQLRNGPEGFSGRVI